MDVGEMGMGWGLSTGLVQWYCADHFVAALARLSGLLEAARRSVAVRSCARSASRSRSWSWQG